ncbi:MAG: hypothetical protein EHM61_00860 [Acidobacteria bacterium]|nr:MAG: hypothetical protein EHM61_00860 [Acidobacteriota bacterium]
MPDLVTHVIAGYGLQRGFRLTPWFLIGAILPDILTRPFTIVWPGSFWWTMPLHTPVGLTLFCAAIAFLHRPGIRASVFLNLGAGAFLHVVLDLFQAHLAGSYYLFFPFSWHSVEIDLIWPETSLYLLPLWAVIGLWLAVKHFRQRMKAEG